MYSVRIVIVGYKPFNGKEKELAELIKDRLVGLRAEGLVTDRRAIVMQSKDGAFIEVFGWKSKEAIEKAHSNIVFIKMKDKFEKVCEYVPVCEII
jgi:hypothetical protein